MINFKPASTLDEKFPDGLTAAGSNHHIVEAASQGRPPTVHQLQGNGRSRSDIVIGLLSYHPERHREYLDRHV